MQARIAPAVGVLITEGTPGDSLVRLHAGDSLTVMAPSRKLRVVLHAHPMCEASRGGTTVVR